MRAAAPGGISLRTWLTAGLVAFLLMACGAPCSGVAAPAPPLTTSAAIAAPADPCQDGKAAPAAPPCCPQIACQTLAAPPAGVALPAPRLSRADFDLSTASLAGRRDEPPTPPPRAQ